MGRSAQDLARGKHPMNISYLDIQKERENHLLSLCHETWSMTPGIGAGGEWEVGNRDTDG